MLWKNIRATTVPIGITIQNSGGYLRSMQRPFKGLWIMKELILDLFIFQITLMRTALTFFAIFIGNEMLIVTKKFARGSDKYLLQA